jgi:hypothetical protein
VTVAGGRFAPGHLGELTQQVPFEMVDAVLEQTCQVQRRVRDLPARVVVYLLLAGCLFSELGYSRIWRKLTAGLDGLPFAVPTASAVTQARRRLGPGPLRALSGLLRGPSPADARWSGLLVCAIDGTIMSVADSAANLAVYSKQRGGPNGGSGYPQLRLLALVSCGTRTVIDAVFRPVSCGETTCTPVPAVQPARRNAPARRPELRRRLPCPEDHGDQAGLPDTRPHRERRPRLPVLRRLPDGSWLSRFGGIPVRVIDAEITVTTSAGRSRDGCRLITTLTNPARCSAGNLAVLYHERWEIDRLP